MKLTKQDAIQKLNALVSRIPALETQKSFSEAFKKWQLDARALLKHVFANDKECIKEFDDISYSLSFCTSETPDSAFADAFRSGLGSARAMLQSRIDEIIQFWPEPDVTTNSNSPAAGPKHPELVFVIHGRQLLGDFHAFLRALGLRPLEWSKARNLTGRPNPYTWEIVDKALSEAGAIVALLTPDDEARLEPHLWSEHEGALEKEYLSQPRQNVLFEAGVAYGRAPERTILIRVGSHRPMSDLAGHHILQLDDSAQSRQAVADALRTAGCPVDVTGADWFRSGKFSLAEQRKGTRMEIETVSVEAEQTKEDAATLLLLKTRMRGYTDLVRAAQVVTQLHVFFERHPKYLNASNVAFLEKYPADFHVKAAFRAGSVPSLDELKRDVTTLHIEPATGVNS
jgi:predicted nucleotide-binding protein